MLPLAGIGHPPDCAAGIVCNQQRAVPRDCERRRTSPHLGTLFARNPKTCGKIFIVAFRPTILERHTHDLVASWFGAVPRAAQRDEGAAFVFCWKLALVEHNVDLRGTAVTRLYASGVDKKDIGIFTGHKDAEINAILERHYLYREQRAEGLVAIDKLDAKFA
jgi:hypothetical protein